MRGGFEFADVTDQVGLDQNNTRWSFAAAWEDFDRDGDPDLYVANDFGRNCLYRNDAGRFVEIAAEARVVPTIAPELERLSGLIRERASGEKEREGRAAITRLEDIAVAM